MPTNILQKLNATVLTTLVLGALCFSSNQAVFAEGQQALSVGVSAVDLPNSSADAVKVEIDKGTFSDFKVGKVALTANHINFHDGTLSALVADVRDGEFDRIWVDKLLITTQAFSFDPFELMNHQRFVLDQAITGAVKVHVSEESLNNFLTHPDNIKSIEKRLAKQTGGMKLLTLSNPKLDVLSRDRVRLNLTIVFGGNLALPMEALGKLMVSEEGNLKFKDLKISSQESKLPIPVDVMSVIEKELNRMIDLKRFGKKHFRIIAQDIDFDGNVIKIDGVATFTKLEFGKR